MRLIDSHTHLDSPEFESDLLEVLHRAEDQGIRAFITIGAGQGGFLSAQNAIKLSERFSNVWATVGIHPHDALEPLNEDQLRMFLMHPKVVAVGETGLDFFRDWCPKANQEQWFKSQVRLALELNKPIVIHSRNAGKEVLQILIEMRAKDVGGVFHCYSEGVDFAKQLREINFMVSFPGTITFKKNNDLREIVKQIPLEQIMVETDAPYMAPEPFRGKRCESSYMIETAKVVAKIKNLSEDECFKELTKNTIRFYKLPLEHS